MPRAIRGYLPLAPLMRAAGCHHPEVAMLPAAMRENAVAKYVRYGEASTRHSGSQLRAVSGASGCDGLIVAQDDSVARLALRLHTTQRTVHRWALGGVPVNSADDLATRLNLNPIEVWGDEWWCP